MKRYAAGTLDSVGQEIQYQSDAHCPEISADDSRSACLLCVRDADDASRVPLLQLLTHTSCCSSYQTSRRSPDISLQFRPLAAIQISRCSPDLDHDVSRSVPDRNTGESWNRRA